MKQVYPITCWYGIRKPFLSRERIVEAIDAGFNIIECAYDTETNLQVLRWCEELGIKANVHDDRMYTALAGEAGWEKAIDGIIEDYKDCPALNRFFVRDEPVDDYFPTLGRVVQYLHEHDPKHGEYINLLPLIAVMPTENYQKHIEGYLHTVQPTILSYDHYNLMKREVEALTTLPAARVSDENRQRNGWENILFEAWDRPTYYDNMEMIRTAAAQAGIPWMTIILLVEHWHYRWPTEAEVRWEAFNALTYGSTALSYFTYWTPGVGHNEPWSYHNGIILTDGTRGEAYEYVKNINRELQTLYTGLVEARPGEQTAPGALLSEAVFHVGAEPEDNQIRLFDGYSAIERIEGGRFTLGFFKGNRFMLTNKDHENAATVTVTTAARLSHLNKATGTWEPCDGSFTLAAGDGELFAFD